MPFNESIAQRVRTVLASQQGISEKKMFGGLAFLLNGNMCCGIVNELLVLRLGNEGTSQALKELHTKQMDFTGKPMKSLLYVEPEGYATDEMLDSWIWRAVVFVSSLSAK